MLGFILQNLSSNRECLISNTIDKDQDRTDQEDEILALSGILDATIFTHTQNDENFEFMGTILVETKSNFAGPMTIINSEGKPNFQIKYLPPIKLDFKLPLDYPSQNSPLFCITCPWLLEKQINDLELELKALWDENGGSVILFAWYNFLQEETLNFLGVENELDISTFTKSAHKNNMTGKNVAKLQKI